MFIIIFTEGGYEFYPDPVQSNLHIYNSIIHFNIILSYFMF